MRRIPGSLALGVALLLTSLYLGLTAQIPSSTTGGAGGGSSTITVTGTANQIDVAGGAGATPTISVDPALVVPGSLTVNVANGSFVDSMFTAFTHTLTSTDSLSANTGVTQYFNMNSNGPSFSISSITNGKTFTLTYWVAVVSSGTASNITTLSPVLCSVAGCGSGTVTPMITASAVIGSATMCALSTTCIIVIDVHCIGTATAGTLMCGSTNGRAYGLVANGANSISGLTGTQYVNLAYAQATQAGNSMSMMAASGRYDTW